MLGSYKTIRDVNGVILDPNRTGQATKARAESQKCRDLKQALQTVSGGVKAREVADVNSDVSTRGLIQRKLYFMKMMLRNEQHANKMISKKIDELSQEMH